MGTDSSRIYRGVKMFSRTVRRLQSWTPSYQTRQRGDCVSRVYTSLTRRSSVDVSENLLPSPLLLQF